MSEQGYKRVHKLMQDLGFVETEPGVFMDPRKSHRVNAKRQPAPTIRRYTKGELLEHYAKRPVTYFTQWDAEDTDNGISYGATAELRGSGIPVRVQIKHGVSQATAVRLLNQLKRLIASDDGAHALAFTVEQEAGNDFPDLPF